MSDKQKLAQLLWDLNILNVEAARIAGVGERTMYRWLSGDTKVPQTAIRLFEMMLQVKKLKIPVAAD